MSARDAAHLGALCAPQMSNVGLADSKRHRNTSAIARLDEAGARAFVERRVDDVGRASCSVALKGYELTARGALGALLRATTTRVVRTLNLTSALDALSAADVIETFIETPWMVDELSLSSRRGFFDEASVNECDVQSFMRALVRAKRVNLSKCSVSCAAARALSVALIEENPQRRCESVNLRDNDVGASGGQALRNACETNGEIVELIVTNNSFIEIADVEAIKGTCARNRRGALARAALEKRAGDNSEALSLRKMDLTDDDVPVVYTCIMQDQTVTHIDIRDNALTASGLQALLEALQSAAAERVVSVNASGNPGFGSNAARKLSGYAAANYVRTNPCIEALKSLSDRHLGDTGAMCVAQALAERTASVTALGVHHNDIGGSGCLSIISALIMYHPLLREFALYSNRIGSEGATSVARLIAEHSALEVLDIGGNLIGDSGCVALANALQSSCHTSKLQELHLDHNGITGVGAQILLLALETRKRVGRPLRSLWLHGNHIDDDLMFQIMGMTSCSILMDGEVTLRRAMESAGSPPTSADIVAAESLATEASAQRLTDSCELANRIAARVSLEYKSRCSAHFKATRGTAVIAGIVARDVNATAPDDIVVISIGVGTKFLPSGVASALGAQSKTHGANIPLSIWDAHVHDSHAEVLARRGLLRTLYRQVEFFIRHGECSLLERSTVENHKLTLKSGVKLHLYISSAPCGAASAGPKGVTVHDWMDGEPQAQAHGELRVNAGWFGACQKGTSCEDSGENGPPGCVVLADGAWSAVAIPGRTLSCSDKIMRWNALGMQGALLGHFVEPIHLASITIGRKYDFDRCTFATCCRHGKTIVFAHPMMLRSGVKLEFSGTNAASGGRELAGDGDESVSWAFGEGAISSHDGRTGSAIGGTGSTSVCSRVVLWHQFLRVVDAIRDSPGCILRIPSADAWTYTALKRASKAYMDARDALVSSL